MRHKFKTSTSIFVASRLAASAPTASGARANGRLHRSALCAVGLSAVMFGLTIGVGCIASQPAYAQEKKDEAKDKTDTGKTPGWVTIKDDPNWTWDPKQRLMINKKNPLIKRAPLNNDSSPSSMSYGDSPLSPEIAGDGSRTYRDPKTEAVVLKEYVVVRDNKEHVYRIEDNFDDKGNANRIEDYNPVADKLELLRRTTTDPKTGIVTRAVQFSMIT
jgi:hypothetical protein